MEYIRHGFSMDIEKTDNCFFISLKATGMLTHKDYEKITSLLDSELEGIEHPELNILFDGGEFQGWELRAALDDFKLGLEHFKEFKKIAIYGNKLWLEILTKVGACILPPDVKYFENLDDASAWVNG
ncbi:MAG: STAS/SEC14 domain-containing protein [Piscirickettsiaceae bacterium]|nr:MAG: STAS/SEC14 domain-containing protein [Piscirickettsiaceae bacterium]PCI66894.1 MAG: STAS/SEC14 domain-containing protein [Piscirickettsiaceae bacterium]